MILFSSAMLENAVRICDASFGMLFRVKDGTRECGRNGRRAAAICRVLASRTATPGAATALGRVVEEKQTVHIADVRTEAAYAEGEPVLWWP